MLDKFDLYYVKSKDISIYSGLSGIGINLLSFYELTKKNIILDKSIQLANEIEKRYFKNNKKIKEPGLLYGWSGASLFLWKINEFMNDNQYKNISIDIMDNIVSNNIDNDSFLVKDYSKGFERLIPYLDSGSSGIALVIIEFANDDNDYLNKRREKVLYSLINASDSYCSYMGGLISGYAGFLFLGNSVKSLKKDSRLLYNCIKYINNYLIKDENNDILFPGKYGIKCSMDIESGASGVLLAINSLKNGQCGSWISTPKPFLFNFGKKGN